MVYAYLAAYPEWVVDGEFAASLEQVCSGHILTVGMSSLFRARHACCRLVPSLSAIRSLCYW